MMSRKRELVRNTAILTIGKICTQCINFFLLPLYTAVLKTEEYGTFDLIITYGTLLLPLVNWQFDQGIFRFLLECREDKEKQQTLFSTAFIANCFQIFIYILIGLIINTAIRSKYIYFILSYVVIQVLTALFLQLSRGLGRNKVYAVSSFISATSTVVLNVIFLCIIQTGLEGLFMATFLAQCITILYLCIMLKPWEFFKIEKFDRETFHNLRKYSLPLVPNNLAWWVVNVSDRTIISFVLGVAFNGIYTVANKFSSVFIQFYNIFNLSWTETVSIHFYDEDRDDFLEKAITEIYNLFSCLCLGVVACMPFIFPYMVDGKYNDAYAQIIILMYAMLFRVFQGLYSCVYIAMKDSKKVASTSIASAAINILVNVLLIKFIGLYAASLSTLIAFGSMAIVRYIDVNKIIKMKIKKRFLLATFVLSLILLITYYANEIVPNVIILFCICVYSYIVNRDFLKTGIRFCKNFWKK